MKTIRALRQANGWTQFELALKVGVQPQAVYFWESGRRTPQVFQLRKLGELFEMCSDDIVLEPIADAEKPSRRLRVSRHSDISVGDRDEVERSMTRGGEGHAE